MTGRTTTTSPPDSVRQRAQVIGCILLCALLACLSGCKPPGQFPPPTPPPPEAILAGDWEGETDDNVMLVFTFDTSGQLTRITAETADGQSGALIVIDSVTAVEADQVTVIIPGDVAAAVYDGILSEDQNTIAGRLGSAVQVGDNILITPQEDLTLNRVDDRCTNDDDCDESEECVDGECVEAGTGCETDNDCPVGEACVDGECIEAGFECESDSDCAEGEECLDAECVEAAPECEQDDDCPVCEACSAGVCSPLVGDADAGAAFYLDNGCAICHGGDAAALIGTNCPGNYGRLSGEIPHLVTVDGVTEQDAADLVAWYDSL